MKCFLLICISCIYNTISFAQNSSIFVGLHELNQNDLKTLGTLNFDPNTLPIFTIDTVIVDKNEIMMMFSSGNFTPTFFVNEKSELKACIMKISTPQQKQEMLDAMNTTKVHESIGKPAPAFEIVDIKGKKWSSEKLKGKIVVLNFWFIECQPCIREMPDLNMLQKKYKRKKVVFLALGVNDKTSMIAFLKDHKFTYNIVPGSNTISKAFGVDGFPTNIVIDKNGIIQYRSSGLSENTISEIERKILESNF
jgi:peroxiredoxin